MRPTERAHWKDRFGQYIDDPWSTKPSLFAEFVLPSLPVGGKLLEIGAGTGQDSIWFASKGYDVTTTDAVVDAFKHISDQAKLHGVELNKKLVDLWNDLSFENDTFDVIYAQLCLQYFTESRTEAIFEELLRILKPNGVLAAMFNSKEDPEYGQGEVIEPDYFKIGKLRKRFYDTDSVGRFAKDLEIIVLDSKGESYKDSAKGVHNMIRLIAKKP